VSRLDAELRRVFGDPPVHPRAVMRVEVGTGQGYDEARTEADRMVDAGAELVVLDATGSRPPVLAALAAVLDLEPVAVVGTQPHDGWREQVVAVRDLVRTAKPLVADVPALLAHLDDPALTRTTGLLAAFADRRTPVLCGGGTTAAAAALLADKVAENRWWLAGSVPALPAAAAAWTRIGIDPLLDLGLTDGSADIAVSVVRAGLEQLGG
jgi:nicotinate-nucleotide--dimethylbenzimidazole phosphoribosyltransferase